MHKATWTKGKRTIRGSWIYDEISNVFRITVFVRDTITGDSERYFTVFGDTPEWYGWKLTSTQEKGEKA